MYPLNRTVVDAFSSQGREALQQGRRVGLEKESLRVDQHGQLSHRPHPQPLGAPLTHDSITTDFAESLLEFATQPSPCVKQTLQSLAQAHRFVAQTLEADGEMLWAGSMPCELGEAEQIPVAHYGSSHLAKLKAAYRQGLAVRYGKPMQVISGVHFNYSLGDDFWRLWGECHGYHGPQALQEARSAGYLHIIRNVQRMAWLIPYLFGASPAMDASFMQGHRHRLQRWDQRTLYLPHATSLRMGDNGYSNNRQGYLGFRASYDNLLTYTNSLAWAMNRYVPQYAELGLHDHQGQWQQLNAHQLQVENEYYSLARPKPLALAGERPVAALRRAGVNYLELRPTDVDLRQPLGMSVEQLQFYELMLVTAALCDSPVLTDAEVQANDENMTRITSRGREPELGLFTACYKQYAVEALGKKLLSPMQAVAELLDSARPDKPYQQALSAQYAKLDNADSTPSAEVLELLKQSGESYQALALHYAKQHQAGFLAEPLSAEQQAQFADQTARSWQALAELERPTAQSFEQYLQAYLSQVVAE